MSNLMASARHLLAAIVVLALPAQADPIRGWRAGADAFGSADTQRVVHYASPGLLNGDKATIAFGISGHFPISLYNVMGDPATVQAGFARLGEDYPEEAQAFTETCMVNTGSFMMDDEMALCIMEQVYADASLELSFLVDVSDMLYSDDPAISIQSIGIFHEETDAYAPILQVTPGALCSGPEEASLCVACYRDFRALSAGDPGAPCGDPDLEYSLLAANARMPYFALIFIMAANQADFGPWKIAVRLERLSGTTQDLTYVSDDLLTALFDRGG